jgi:hypothetical protein
MQTLHSSTVASSTITFQRISLGHHASQTITLLHSTHSYTLHLHDIPTSAMRNKNNKHYEFYDQTFSSLSIDIGFPPQAKLSLHGR